MRRKLLLVSGAMAFGVWLSENCIAAAAGIALAAFLYCIVLYIHPDYDTQNVRKLLLCCVIAIVLGALRMQLEILRYSDISDVADGKAHKITAEVIRTEQKTDKQAIKTNEERIVKKIKLIIRVVRIDGKKPKLFNCRKALITLKGSISETNGTKGVKETNSTGGNMRAEEPWRLTGSMIQITTELEVPQSNGNPKCFDYNLYLKTRGIAYTGKIYSYRKINGGRKLSDFFYSIKHSMLIALISFREKFINSIPESKDHEVRALIRGMIFGDTQEMPDDIREDFRRNGTAHVLAVSGLHIGILYSIFIELRKRAGSAVMTPVFFAALFSYGTITMWSVSVTRAVALIVIMETGNRLDRPYDILTSLGAVSMLVLTANPYALFSASFAMSFLAVLSIGMISPVVKSIFDGILPQGICISIAVQAGLLPYVIYTFNCVPLAAVILNIPVIMLLSFIVSLSAFMMSIVLISDAVMKIDIITSSVPLVGSVSGMTGWLISELSSIMLFLNKAAAGLEIICPDVISPPLAVIATVYAVLIAASSENVLVAKLRKDTGTIGMYLGIAVMIIALTAVFTESPFDKADIVFVDVGQGDCLHLRYRSDDPLSRLSNLIHTGDIYTDVMIDGGGNEEYNIGKNTLKPYFLKNGTRTVDLTLATHLHTDHYKGLEELYDEGIAAKLVTVGKTGDVISIDTGRTGKKRSGGNVEGKNGGTGDRIEIIYPDVQDPDTDDENKNSLIFKIYISGITVLVTGDLGEEGERALVRKYQGTNVLDCDVLKVCHHGSATSSSTEFLKAVSPAVALIGAGKNNIYGHPSQEALSRLKSCGAKVYRTDLDGAIGIRVIKAGLRICRMRDHDR